MPVTCSVFGCSSIHILSPKSNSTRENISFHRFPKDEAVRSRWISSCKRQDNINANHARMCSKHFEPKDYERNLKYELLDIPVPSHLKKLRPTAVPTLFLSSLEDNSNSAKERESRAERRVMKRKVEELISDSISDQYVERSSTEAAATLPPMSTEDAQQELYELKKDRDSLLVEKQEWDEEKDTLQKEIQCVAAKGTAHARSTLNGMFSPSQVDSILPGKPVKHYWSEEDISKAPTLPQIPKMNKTSQVEKLPWTRYSESSLLELVKENRILWDHKDPQYFKTKLRQNTYQTIAETLRLQHPEFSDLNGEHVRQKFKNIRTYFLNLYRKIQKAPTGGSGGQPTHKWPLFDYANFLVESMADTSDSCSCFSVPAPEEPSSETETMAPSMLQTAFVQDQEENGSVPDGGEIPSFGDASPSTSSSSGHQISPTKRSAISPKRRTKKIASNDIVDRYTDSSNCFLQNKQNLSPLAVSLGLLVEASVDKLPHERQIWFAQKLTNLIAKANNLDVQTD